MFLKNMWFPGPMVDVFILEDNELYREEMKLSLEGVDIYFACTGEEFKEFLEIGCSAKMYFLDDIVPPSEGDEEKSLFTDHCTLLLEKRPGSSIFYAGSFPIKETVNYCNEHGVKILKRKMDLIGVVEEAFSGN